MEEHIIYVLNNIDALLCIIIHYYMCVYTYNYVNSFSRMEQDVGDKEKMLRAEQPNTHDRCEPGH